MSCGNHHETPCRDVLTAIFIYLDNEVGDESRSQAITIHLEECGPCQQEFAYEERVRLAISKACKEEAPQELRARVIQTFTEFRLTMTEIDLPNN